MGEEKKNEILDQAKALSEQELSDVAGGGKCVCYLGGGGEADVYEKTCACVGVGFGESDKWGEEVLGSYRCVCSVYGTGDDYATGWEEKNKNK